MITRITKLSAYDNVLMGRDIANVFEEGHVYDIKKVMGQIIVTDLGKHAKNASYIGAGIAAIATEGIYCLTESEYAIQVKQQGYDQ